MLKKRAGLLLRTVAKSIDFILILAAMEALPKYGWLAGLIYLLIGDGLFEGKSVGKKITGLWVETDAGSPCSIRDSVLRNSTLGVGFVLYMVPFIGLLLLIVIVAIEFIIMVGSKEYRRLGDEIARTTVCETVGPQGAEQEI